uniref:Uncharacterized protein n=1 Tax=Glossina austeni TaxID=7395 RepID=A0A1A9V0Q4_GLOAU
MTYHHRPLNLKYLPMLAMSSSCAAAWHNLFQVIVFIGLYLQLRIIRVFFADALTVFTFTTTIFIITAALTEVLVVAQQPIGATLEPVDVDVIRCSLAVSLDGAAVATMAPLAVPLRNVKICSDSSGGASISIGIAPELVVIIGYGCVEADELAIVTICNVCGGASDVSAEGGDVWGGIDDLRLFTKR